MLITAATLWATVKGLQCEYMEQPVGVDKTHPRLSWILSDPRPAVTVHLWDPQGTIDRTYRLAPGTQQMAIDTALPAAHTFLWTVTIGKETSDTARFTTHLPLGNAQWISDGHNADHWPSIGGRYTSAKPSARPG